MAKRARQGRLDTAHVIHVPLREVSGICLRRGAGDDMTLIAIGDRVAVAAWARFTGNDADPLEWEKADISGLRGSQLPSDDPQIEAVTADGAGRVLLLQESPSRAELVDIARVRVVASITLEVPGNSRLARAWADPMGSHGEGAVLMRNGHVLIAKEKDPSALIEFGPEGDESLGLSVDTVLGTGERWAVANGDHVYVALAIWRPSDPLSRVCADFSDLAVGPDGHLYVLSDKSSALARLEALDAGGGDATMTESWRVDALAGKPEGLAFTAEGRAMVAYDTQAAHHNLAILDPPVAPRE